MAKRTSSANDEKEPAVKIYDYFEKRFDESANSVEYGIASRISSKEKNNMWDVMVKEIGKL